MTALAVIGLQWGDEGKGKIVDLLAADAAHVARFQGGHNAGHTLTIGGRSTVLHLLPSGVLHPGVRCYLGGGVVLSPSALLEEIQALDGGADSLRGRFFIASSAALVLPCHVALDKKRDTDGIGTTLRGIGPAHEDKTARRALRVYDLQNKDGREKFNRLADRYDSILQTQTNREKVWQTLQEQMESLSPFVCDDIGERLAAADEAGETILLEGAQGVMLDIEQGTYPFVTSAQCLPAAAAGGLGAELSPTTLGVSKAYATRVGNGPFPTELQNEEGEKLAALGGEVGATTGRRRRCGWLDLPMLRRALRVCGCKKMALTKMDVLDQFDNIPVCVHYTLDGKTILNPPADPSALSRCIPHYETLPGWRGEQVANAETESALPSAARRYIARLEELLQVRIILISTSPRRESAILRENLFA